MTFQEHIKEILSPLPSEWSDKITQALVAFKESIQVPDCEDFKNCETLTSISPFGVSGDTISIAYTDEKNVTVTRPVSLSQVINTKLDGIVPGCLTDITTWSNMTYQERIQAIIDAHCECCE